MRSALHAVGRNGLRRDAPRDRSGQCAACPPARNHQLHFRKRGGPGARGHQRSAPCGRNESPRPEHLSDAHEPARKPRPVHAPPPAGTHRSEEHTSELQSRLHLVCRLLLEKKKKKSIKLTCVLSKITRRTCRTC